MVTYFWPSVLILAARKTSSGFSCASTAPEASAGCASAQLMKVGLAPMPPMISPYMGLPTTRILMPFRSSGCFTGRLLLLICR